MSSSNRLRNSARPFLDGRTWAIQQATALFSSSSESSGERIDLLQLILLYFPSNCFRSLLCACDPYFVGISYHRSVRTVRIPRIHSTWGGLQLPTRQLS